MSTATEEKVKVVVHPFTMEADHPRNGDLLIQNIPNCRLRSRLRSDRLLKDRVTGEEMMPRDQASGWAGLPRVPGMTLMVNPAKLTYRIIDLLEGDDDLCDRIHRFMKSKHLTYSKERKIRGCPPQTGKLDVHAMKTLVREMVWIVEEGHAKVTEGTKPKLETVDKLPGKYLLNPSSRNISNSLQPRYEEDMSKWLERLSTMGG